MSTQKTHDRWLRSRPTSGAYAPGKVDAENGIIHDVVMVQEGEAKGHDVHLDAGFISDLVQYDQRVFGERGVKGRFGHPNASSETMGTQMGMFKNIRERKQGGKMQAIGDLHLLAAADESPTHPGMRAWILKMAEEQPDFLMSSIVFREAYLYQKDKDGNEHVLVRDTNPFSEQEFTNLRKEIGKTYVKLKEHHFTDLVEQGAATDSLFSNDVNPHLFVAQADEFLAQHPQIKNFIAANPEKVIAFFDSVGISLTKKNTQTMSKFNLFSWLSGEAAGDVNTEDLEALRTALSEAQTQVTSLNAAKEAAENAAKAAEQQLSTVQAHHTALQAEQAATAKALADAQAEITQLKEEAADVHTGGTGGEGGTKERAYMQTPIYQKFRKKTA